jgi:hypothetical protein
MRLLYAIYDNGEYIGDYRAKEAAQICGINSSRVGKLAESGRLINDRYRFEAVDTVIKWTSDLADRWDRLRLRILTAGEETKDGQVYTNSVFGRSGKDKAC